MRVRVDEKTISDVVIASAQLIQEYCSEASCDVCALTAYDKDLDIRYCVLKGSHPQYWETQNIGKEVKVHG